MARLSVFSKSVACLVVISTFFGCTRRDPPAPAPAPSASAAKGETESGTKIVFLGDSLTEGLGVTKDEAFPALVDKALRTKGLKVNVVNAGVSGSTSASGPSRMKWVLKGKPAVVVVALGANDGLRGFPAEETKKNLQETVRLAKDAKVKVLLVGMQVPPNYGPEYGKKFSKIFPDVARELGVPLVPFLLEGVAGEPNLNTADRIHPNPAGHEIMAKTVLKHLEPLL